MTTDPQQAIHRVEGLTCDHCVRAVTEEVGAIPGVTSVHVELATGDVTVASTRPITHDELSTAIHEAGYELAG